MFPADFAYARARSLDEALDLLGEAAQAGEEAKLIAGGQSLLPMMKLRLAAPQVLIDIAGLAELQGGPWDGHTRMIGALTTYRQLGRQRYVDRDGTPALVNGAPGFAAGIPALADALAVLADPQVRARGTIGGAVAHGDPAADLPAVLLALNAEVVIAARAGTREVILDDFLQGVYATDLAEDEIVTHVRVHTADARGGAYEKFPHPASHLPLVGVAAAVTFRGGRLTDSGGNVTDLNDGSIDRVAIAVTGISPRPYRAHAAEAVLKGAFPAPAALAAAAAQVTMAAPGSADRVSLLGDQHASADYRVHLAEVLTRRALAKALTRGGRN